MKLKATGMNIFSVDGAWMLQICQSAFENTDAARAFAEDIVEVWNASWKSTELAAHGLDE